MVYVKRTKRARKPRQITPELPEDLQATIEHNMRRQMKDGMGIQEAIKLARDAGHESLAQELVDEVAKAAESRSAKVIPLRSVAARPKKNVVGRDFSCLAKVLGESPKS